MWRLQRLVIENLQSHKHQDIAIRAGETTLVSGENNTDQDSNSNGSGKSGFLEGITLLLLGEPCRKITLKKLIRRGEKMLTVYGELYNTATNQEMKIWRELPASTSSSKCRIELNGVDPGLAGVDHYNKKDPGVNRCEP